MPKKRTNYYSWVKLMLGCGNLKIVAVIKPGNGSMPFTHSEDPI
jgi:hypothetical protein